MSKSLTAIGLMSGTSHDGVDASIIKTDGHKVNKLIGDIFLEYPDRLKSEIDQLIHGNGDLLKIEKEITLHHIEAVEKLLASFNLDRELVDVIGFHGQTIKHRPDENLTWQIGNGAMLCEKTGINVVTDFRRRDMGLGGQGAPLLPLYHLALFRDAEKPIAILNIGGVSNITYISPDNSLIAFDMGPGCGLTDYLTRKFYKENYDADGEIAYSGHPDQKWLDNLLDTPFFKKAPPKSLDKFSFSFEKLELMEPKDAIATASMAIILAIKESQLLLPAIPKSWVIAGGGRHNKFIMQKLAENLGNLTNIDRLGLKGDFIESQGFAYLAARSIAAMPITDPAVTGATHPSYHAALYLKNPAY